MIIDGHAHASGPFLRAEGIAKALDAAGVDQVVLVSGKTNSEQTYSLPRVAHRFPNTDVVAWTNRLTRVIITLTRGARHIAPGNALVYRLSRELPDRVIPFHWVVPSREGILGELDRLYHERRFRGLKLHQCWNRFRVRSANFEAVMGWAEEKDLPVFIHLYDRRGVRELIDYLRHHREAKVIVGHLFGLEDYAASGLHSERIYFDISTHELVSTQRILKALEYCGAQQVVMGSDTPYASEALPLAIERVRRLPISEPEKNSILGGNLQRLLET
jgi:predicted TIM-barrel fold metal-dependent hydrolase